MNAMTMYPKDERNVNVARAAKVRQSQQTNSSLQLFFKALTTPPSSSGSLPYVRTRLLHSKHHMLETIGYIVDTNGFAMFSSMSCGHGGRKWTSKLPFSLYTSFSLRGLGEGRGVKEIV